MKGNYLVGGRDGGNLVDPPVEKLFRECNAARKRHKTQEKENSPRGVGSRIRPVYPGGGGDTLRTPKHDYGGKGGKNSVTEKG